MDTSFDKRMELYNNAPEAVRNLYGGELATKTIKKAADLLNLQEPERETFVITVGDIILGLYQKKSLPQLLQDRLSLASVVTEPAISILYPLLERIPEPVTNTSSNVFTPTTKEPETLENEEERNAENTPTEPTQSSTTAQETVPTPVTPAQDTGLKKVRTFADDVASSRVHGYGAFRQTDEKGGQEDGDNSEEPTHRSSQDDIIKK